MEQRLHVVVTLPSAHHLEARAFNSVVRFISQTVFPGEGYSLQRRIDGYWLSTQTRKLVVDLNTFYITDVPRSDAAHIESVLKNIRQFALDAYQKAGRPQDEIWITSHPIERCTV